MKPICIDLFSGLGGWSEGFLAEGYTVVGFDNHRHEYWMPDVSASEDGHKNTKPVEKRGWTQGCAISLGMEGPNANARRKLVRYPGQLVIQDVLTLHGSQFRNATVIVASPPCQNYSYLAMPWSRSSDPNNSKAAKSLRLKWETEGPDNRLFDACFRIQREAEIARAHMLLCCVGDSFIPRDCRKPCPRCHIPLIVENVRGAQPWVGRSAWNYGSFHLWGDVPALMPINLKRGQKVPGFRFDGSGGSFQTAAVEGMKGDGGGWFGDSGHAGDKARRMELERPGGPLDPNRGQKVPAYSDPRRNGGKGVHLTSPRENDEGLKIGGDWFRDPACHSAHGSRSNARKAASAQIAKIPFALSSHIARVYRPRIKATA